MASKKEIDTDVSEGHTKRSIAIKLIRHAESKNNEVYTNARHIYKGGTPDFDSAGWHAYVNEHRKADPGISTRGHEQADKLKDYLVEHLENQSSHPVRVITSPMRRTLETILPTLTELNKEDKKVELIVNALYHESEGCHTHDIPESGMNQHEIKQFLSQAEAMKQPPKFVGFTENPDDGWYTHGTGAETRAEAETRASAFYLWLCEYLDNQLFPPESENDDNKDYDLFDAGVSLPSEVHENEHDKLSPRQRRRRTAVLMGHGDFMGLVLKRIVAGFGHSVENEGIPHRSAFVHFNTGITELEYFGRGRFLLMQTNNTPHLQNHSHLKAGGGLKDGWSYIMPTDKIMLYEEVSSSFADELDEHLKEQTNALKNLYLPSGKFLDKKSSSSDDNGQTSLAVEEMDAHVTLDNKSTEMTFVVKRGLQVVGCINFDDNTGEMSELVVRPSAAKEGNVGEKLILAVLKHAKKVEETQVFMHADTADVKDLLQQLGFQSSNTSEGGKIKMMYQSRL